MNRIRKKKFFNWLNGETDKDILENIVDISHDEGYVNNADTEAFYDALKEIEPEERIEYFEIRSFQRLYSVLSILICLIIVSVLIYTVSFLPRFGSEEQPDNNEVSQRYIEKGTEETGAVNAVTGMILDYRAFDTLGESFVLFSAVIAVFILLRYEGDGINEAEIEDNDSYFNMTRDVILRKVSIFIVPAIFMFGLYIILNGHLSPGGGFSGGAVLGAGLILYSISYGNRIKRFLNQKVYNTIIFSSLFFYCIAKSFSFYTGANDTDIHIPLGIPGNILSGGLILPLNICVGLIVACVMYGFYTIFKRGKLD